MSRFPSSPFSYYSVLIREPKKKKGKRVLLGHLVFIGLKGDPGVFGTVKWLGSTAQSGLNVQKGLQFGLYGSSVKAQGLSWNSPETLQNPLIGSHVT